MSKGVAKDATPEVVSGDYPVLMDVTEIPEWVVSLHLFARTMTNRVTATDREYTHIVRVEVAEMGDLDRLPFTKEVKDKFREHDRIFLVYRRNGGTQKVTI